MAVSTKFHESSQKSRKSADIFETNESENGTSLNNEQIERKREREENNTRKTIWTIEQNE